MIHQYRQELADRNAELEQSLENLRVAQESLVQTEKMASLGQLAAGLAHEINNPLNFVINSSKALEKKLSAIESTNLGDEEKADHNVGDGGGSGTTGFGVAIGAAGNEGAGSG